MRRRDILRRAGRSLRQAKVRTLLTSFAIAVGAFTLTVSLAAGEGSRQYADNVIKSNVDPQSAIVAKDDSLFGGGSANQTGLRDYDSDSLNAGGNVNVKSISEDDIKKLEQNQNIDYAQRWYSISAQYITFEGDSKKYVSDIIQYDPGIRGNADAGNLPELKQDIGSNEAVIPHSFAEKLGVSPQSLIGKKITMTIAQPSKTLSEAEINKLIAEEGLEALKELTQQVTRDVTVVVRAVQSKAATALAENQNIQISDVTAKSMNDFTTTGTARYHKYFAATVRIKDGVDPEVVKADLQKEGFTVQTAKDLQGFLFTIVNTLQAIVVGFGILALFASVFGIINTQYISVLERTQQIGLMKALGMRNKDVAKLFRYEAAWIGFLGGIIGAAGAWALGMALNPWITKQLSLGDGNYLLIFQPIPIAILIIVLILIAVVAGFFPARKAAKLDPIEALRTE